MKYIVDIGRADGKAGDTIPVEAANPEDAAQVALATQHDPSWVVLNVQEDA